ncbi:unnamed protein product [Orchesella dallaii]|uniref:Uncharacterized protein n=1 Tax=Orchesella dallaii TaxID=48710 RepID=A0ABP1S0U5_9HEXA
MVAVNMEAMKGPMMMANLMVGGAAFVFLLSTILATVVFDETGQNSTIAEQEIQMAMQVFPTEQHVKVWMDAVIPLHILVDIVNISKIDSEGNEEPGGLVDLFPVGEPATGKGTIIFKITTVNSAEMPDLMNRTQEVIPMAFIKEETFSPGVRSFLRLGAVSLNNIGLITGLMVVASLGMIGGGAGLLYLDKKRTPVTIVKAVKEG